MTRLALALVIAAAGCAAESVPAPSAAHGMKRWSEAGVSRHHLSGKARSRRGPLLSAASRSLSRPAIAHDWSGVAACESTGRWHIADPPYFGGLQMDAAFWTNYGGLQFAPRPDLASELEQTVVAERGLAVQGIGAWPRCGVYLRSAA